MRGKRVSLRIVSLEIPLERKLRLSARSKGAINDSEVCVVVVRGLHTGSKVRVVEEVEELRSKLQVRGFSRPESLEDREIQIVVGRAVHLVPWPS